MIKLDTMILSLIFVVTMSFASEMPRSFNPNGETTTFNSKNFVQQKVLQAKQAFQLKLQRAQAQEALENAKIKKDKADKIILDRKLEKSRLENLRLEILVKEQKNKEFFGAASPTSIAEFAAIECAEVKKNPVKKFGIVKMPLLWNVAMLTLVNKNKDIDLENQVAPCMPEID